MSIWIHHHVLTTGVNVCSALGGPEQKTGLISPMSDRATIVLSFRGKKACPLSPVSSEG